MNLPYPGRRSTDRGQWRGGRALGWLAAAAMATAAGGLAGCHRLYPMPGPTYHVMVYVAGRGAGILALDARTLKVAPPLAAEGTVVALAYNPARAELYALDQTPGRRLPGSLAVFPLAGKRRALAIPLDVRPKAMALSADGALAYIAGGHDGHAALYAVDLPSRSVTHRMALGGRPAALALAPAERVVVATADPPRLEIVGAQTFRPAATLPLPAPPTQVIALPYGHKAFVLCPAANEVAVVDLAPPASVLTYLSVGPDPKAMALKPDGGELYVSNYGDRGGGTSISIVDTAANQVAGSMVVGTGPWGLAVSPDGSRLYVANHVADTVDVINLETRHVLSAIPVGLGPERLALGGLGAYLFVEDQTSSDIAVIRTDIPALMTLLPSLPGAREMQVAEFRSPVRPARR